jgi:glyoxylase-like metal-dependent hydrolase (beta-lactamase superfamily II)
MPYQDQTVLNNTLVPPTITMEPLVHTVFEPQTSTWQYVVADPSTKAAVIIDPVLDFDPARNAISTKSADGLLALVKEQGYTVDRLLETHAHADHLTAAKYLQDKLAKDGKKPEITIGKRIAEVQERFAKRYGIAKEEYERAFDKLLDDDEVFHVGQLEAKAVHLPGHTPDHMGYLIGGESI